MSNAVSGKAEGQSMQFHSDPVMNSLLTILDGLVGSDKISNARRRSIASALLRRLCTIDPGWRMVARRGGRVVRTSIRKVFAMRSEKTRAESLFPKKYETHIRHLSYVVSSLLDDPGQAVVQIDAYRHLQEHPDCVRAIDDPEVDTSPVPPTSSELPELW